MRQRFNIELFGFSFRVLFTLAITVTSERTSAQIQILRMFNSIDVISDSQGNYYPYSFSSRESKTNRTRTYEIIHLESGVAERLTFDSVHRLTGLQLVTQQQIVFDYNRISYSDSGITYHDRSMNVIIPVSHNAFLNSNLLDMKIAANSGIKNNTLAILNLSSNNYQDTLRLASTKSSYLMGYRECFRSYFMDAILPGAMEFDICYPELGRVLRDFYFSCELSRDSVKAYYNSEGTIIGFMGSISSGRVFGSNIWGDARIHASMVFPTQRYRIVEYQGTASKRNKPTKVAFYSYKEGNNYGPWLISALVENYRYVIRYSYAGILKTGILSVMKIPRTTYLGKIVEIKEKVYYTNKFSDKSTSCDSPTVGIFHLKTK